MFSIVQPINVFTLVIANTDSLRDLLSVVQGNPH